MKRRAPKLPEASLSQQVLAVLTAKGAMTSYELADFLQRSPQSVASACQTLAAKGRLDKDSWGGVRPYKNGVLLCPLWSLYDENAPICERPMVRCREPQPEIGITDEDEAWMQKYRQQKLERQKRVQQTQQLLQRFL